MKLLTIEFGPIALEKTPNTKSVKLFLIRVMCVSQPRLGETRLIRVILVCYNS